MKSSISIYIEKISPRINYIFDFVLHNFSGIDFTFISNEEEFLNLETSKINASNKHFEDEINLEIDEVLFFDETILPIDYTSLALLGKCFYWLSRYEEYLAETDQFDEHQRYLGSVLDYSQPIVDQLCLALQEIIKEKYPEIRFKTRVFKQINTHDVDYTWKYLHHSTQIKYGSFLKKILKGDFRNAITQFQVLIGNIKDPYATYDYLEELAKEHQIETIFFWLLGDYSTFDKNHSFQNKAQKELIQSISTWASLGIHPSYASNNLVELQNIELRRLEDCVGKHITKSRQHFIKLVFPQTYQQLLINDITEDYTMGFPHRTGFRAGTSTPFNWFDLSTNQPTELIIYPFVAMDVTLRNYLKLSPEEAIEELNQLKQTIKKVDGTFITLFHQSNLKEDWLPWLKVYESIFND